MITAYLEYDDGDPFYRIESSRDEFYDLAENLPPGWDYERGPTAGSVWFSTVGQLTEEQQDAALRLAAQPDELRIIKGGTR